MSMIRPSVSVILFHSVEWFIFIYNIYYLSYLYIDLNELSTYCSSMSISGGLITNFLNVFPFDNRAVVVE